jgi:HSP20 family molecular chaperone IbpA
MLPEEIVPANVTAKVNQGILQVELPKKTPTHPEEPTSVKIE